MNLEYMTKIAEALPFDKELPIYSNYRGYVIYFCRPSNLPSRFTTYDINKNFQIWLKEPNKNPYKPTHLQLLFDLYFMVKEYPRIKNNLLETFDKIFYGEDVLTVIENLPSLKYALTRVPIEINAILAQSFIVEQNLAYGNRSKFDPPSLYIQGWIRTFIDSYEPLDKLCYQICRNNPPPATYTCQDDKKNKKYNPSNFPLWYTSNQQLFFFDRPSL